MKRWILDYLDVQVRVLFTDTTKIFFFNLFLLFLLPKIQIQVDAILQMTSYKIKKRHVNTFKITKLNMSKNIHQSQQASDISSSSLG